MNITELNMYDLLKKLKEKHNITGIKISYEDEGLTGDLAQVISSIAFKAGVAVSVKIGGCEAKRDLRDAKILGADKIVAPMIETPYALKKFIDSVHCIYDPDEIAGTKFLANVETVTGYQNLEQMMQSPAAKEIYGIVLGRVDYCGSIGKDRSFINSPEMQQIALNVAEKAGKHGKKFFIGGGVSLDSLHFFRQIPQDVFASFETRNIIFDVASALKDPEIDRALVDAQGFELAWMKRKKEIYGQLSNAENQRIEMMMARYSAALAHLK